jgi:hypothetical protein
MRPAEKKKLTLQVLSKNGSKFDKTEKYIYRKKIKSHFLGEHLILRNFKIFKKSIESKSSVAGKLFFFNRPIFFFFTRLIFFNRPIFFTRLIFISLDSFFSTKLIFCHRT